MNQQKSETILPALAMIAVVLLVMSDPAFAQLDKIGSLFDNLKLAMSTIGASVMTVAIIWCGYKFLFGHATIKELLPIIGGGVLIGGAFQIANMIIGKTTT